MDGNAQGKMRTRPKISIRTKGLLAFLFVSLVWGSTWAVGKEAVFEMPVLTLSYLRNAIAGILLVGFFLLKGYPVPKGAELRHVLLLSLFLFVFNTGFSMWSLRFIPAHTAAIIGCTSPLLIYTLQAALHRHKFNGLFVAGCIISLVGVVLLVYDGAAAMKESYLLGIALSVAAVLAWCIGVVMMEGKKKDFNLNYSFGWQLLFSAGILYGVALLTDNTIPLLQISLKGWMTIGYLSLFGSVLAFICLAYIVKHLPAGIASLYVFINPVVAVILSILLLNEELTTIVAIGAALSLLGVWVSMRKRKNIHAIKNPAA